MTREECGNVKNPIMIAIRMQFYVMPLPGRGWGWGREESWRDRNKRKNISYLIQHQQHALRYPFFIFKSLLLLTWIVHTHMCTLWTNKKRDENWWKLKENFTFLCMNRMWRKVIVWIIIITNHCVVVEPLKLLDRRKRFYRDDSTTHPVVPHKL